MKDKRKEIVSFSSLQIGYESGKFRKVLLPPLNASASAGELIAVIGKNGIGKSTLLGTIAGLRPLLGGMVRIDGRNIHEYSRMQLSGKVGYISTEIVKVSNLRVYDLVALGRFPHTDWFGRIDTASHKAVMDAIMKTGMSEFIDRPVTELSDGERQRAMIAMVLAQDAVILVMDEPTAFLDISSKYEVMNLMHDLARKRNKTIIYSTHDFYMAVSQADKIWLMLDDGLLEGAPEDIMISGSFKNLFDESKVSFNTQNGSFSLRSKPRGFITVSGDGDFKYWTEKAITRAGYSVSESKSSDISVEVRSGPDSGWKCNIPGHTAEFENIYDLINWIRTNTVNS